MLVSSLVFLALVAIQADVTRGQTYTGSAVLGASPQDTRVEWEIVGREITFLVSAPKTASWIGLGFNSQNDYTDADFYLAYATWSGDAASASGLLDAKLSKPLESSKGTMRAVLIDDTAAPIGDLRSIQSITRNESRTSVKFSRNLDTCGAGDQVLNTGTTFLIVAHGSTMPRNLPGATGYGEYDIDITPNTTTTFFDIVPIRLFADSTSKEPVFPAVSDSTARNIVINPVTVPLIAPVPQTTQMCRLEKLTTLLPAQSDTTTIIGYSVVGEVLGSSVAAPVASIRLTVCPSSFDPTKFSATQGWENGPINCQPGGVFDSVLAECQETVATWFAGSKSYRFPDKVAYPMGKTEFGNRLMLLQVVFRTEKLSQLVVSQSTGLTLHLSDTPIEQKAGFLTVSASPSFGLILPPKQTQFRVRTICDTQCTQKNVPQNGISLFSVMHQTRQLGREVRTRLIRAGREVKLISDDIGHTAAFQPQLPLSPTVQVQRGDQILLECTFNTQDRDVTVFGGNTTVDELCAATFGYYPRVENFFICGSVPEPRHIFPVFGVSDYESAFSVSGNNSQYKVKSADALTRLKTFKPVLTGDFADKCFAPRISSLYSTKRHMPFCGPSLSEDLSVIRTTNIQFLPEPASQCPARNATAAASANVRFPVTCADTVYPDEIEAQILCPGGGNGRTDNAAGVAVFSVFLTVAFAFLSVCA